MAKFSWRSLVFSTLAASSLLTGTASTSEACCLFGGWGDCCGGSYGGGYYRGYSGYYGGYAPYYGSYAPAYGYGPAYAYGYGDTFASAGYGCSSCVGGGCGISTPATNPTKPEPDSGPDDGYRGTPGSRLKDTPPVEGPRRSRLNTGTNPADPPARSTRPGASPREDGLGRSSTGTKEPPDTDVVEEEPFRTPRRSGGTGTGVKDQFDVDANKPPMPDSAEEQLKKKDDKKPAPPVDNDSFDEDASTEVKVEKPELGASSDTDEHLPADADAAAKESHPSGDVIPPRTKPAQIDIPDPEEIAPESQLPGDLKNLDEKPASAGVAPKVRLVLRGRFGTPSIVRLKLRPNHDWQPTANPPVLAKH